MRFYEDIWNKCFIGDFLKIKSGRDQKTVANANGNYNVYGTGGVIGKATSYIYDRPTVCIGRKGTINCPFYLEEKFWCVDTLFYSQINNDKVVPKFIYYLFETIDWKKKNQSTGVPSLTSTVIENTKVFIPSLKNQTKISNFLSILDSRIHTQNKIIEDLIALRNQINNAFFDSINTCVRFSELYTSASEGGTPDTSKGEYYLNGTIPFVKIENLYEKYLLLSNSFISESGLQNSSAWLVPKESILLSNGATIGETTILKMDAATKQGILGIIPKKPYDSEILYYLFKSRRFAKTLKRITTKGTMEAAYLKDLNKEKVFLTCDENMNSHIRLMSLIDERINVERQIVNLLVKEKQYLLGNLFI